MKPKRKRKPLNPTQYRQAAWRIKALRQIATNVALYHRLLGDPLGNHFKLDHLRDHCTALLGVLLAPSPVLVDPDELEIVDLHAGKRKGFHSDWAIRYRGTIIKKGFETDSAALLYIRRHLIRDNMPIGPRQEIAVFTGAKSWAIH